MVDVVASHFRCPDGFGEFGADESKLSSKGFFRFGTEIICYGRTLAGRADPSPDGELRDVSEEVSARDGVCHTPFQPDEVVGNLRGERYVEAFTKAGGSLIGRCARGGYYLLRPLLPVGVRKHIQRFSLRDWETLKFPQWPVDTTVDKLLDSLLLLSMKARGVSSVPFVWFWPRGFRSCAIVTHDVETASGRDFCGRLMDVDESHGVKSSFQVVPEKRYEVPDSFIASLRDRGFEVNLHGLNHDGKLFSNQTTFLRRARRINEYAKRYGCKGFRSPVLYRNQDWLPHLDVDYDMSVPNVGHLDPQRGGCCTVKPYFVGRIVELPLTTIQDYGLFHFLGAYSVDLWKTQTDAVMAAHGLVSFNVHPDYVSDKRALTVYEALLDLLDNYRTERQLWIALPGEVERWWRVRQGLKLVDDGQGWRIAGEGSEDAQLAFARIAGDGLIHEFQDSR